MSKSKTVCNFPNCNNKTYSEETGNFRYSKMYCSIHILPVPCRCSKCHKELKIKSSDLIAIIENGKDIICKSCQITDLNKSPKMREQARQLGLKTGRVNIKKAHKKPRTEEQNRKMIQTRIDNGYYSPGGGYEKALKTRKENGSLEKFISAGHSKEARRKANKKAWSNLTQDERNLKMKHVRSFETDKSRKLIIENRVKNGWSPNTTQARSELKRLIKDENWLKDHPNFLKFNREYFYNNLKIDMDFAVDGTNDLDTYGFIEKFDNVACVKAYELIDENGLLIETLDVAKTNGTTKELSWFYRTMEKAKEQFDIPKEELKNFKDYSVRIKRRNYLEEQKKVSTFENKNKNNTFL